MMPFSQTCPRTLQDSFPVVFSVEGTKHVTSKNVTTSGNLMSRGLRRLKRSMEYAGGKANLKLYCNGVSSECVLGNGVNTYLRQL